MTSSKAYSSFMARVSAYIANNMNQAAIVVTEIKKKRQLLWLIIANYEYILELNYIGIYNFLS